MPAKTLLVDLTIRYGFQVLGAVVILAVGVLVARWTGALVDRQLQNRAMEPPMRALIVRVIRVVVFVFALVLALDKFGFQVAPLVAGIGVAGLGLGIAVQGVLSNIVAGLTIIFTKPFRVGEYIELGGVHGEVIAINLPSTALLHGDRSIVVIPNRKIVGEILHNFGTTRQIHLTATVPHGADLSAVLSTTRDVVTRNDRVLKDPAPAVGIEAITDAGVRIGASSWVRSVDVGAVDGELYWSLIETFRAHGIGVGLPRREVRLLDGAPVS